MSISAKVSYFTGCMNIKFGFAELFCKTTSQMSIMLKMTCLKTAFMGYITGEMLHRISLLISKHFEC